MTNTHGLGSQQREMQTFFGEAFSGYLVSGGLPAVPASSLTIAAFATNAYVDNAGEMFYVSQEAASVTVPNSTPVWLAIHRNRHESVSGWTRQTGTHYLFQQNATQPANPAGGLVFSEVTVSGGVITATNRAAPTGAVPSTTVASGQLATEFGVVADDSTDNSVALQRALDTTKHITLPAGIIRFGSTLTINEGQVLEGAGLGDDADFGTGTVLRYTGSGVAMQITETGSSFGNQTLILRDFTLRATGGTIGIHVTNVGASDVVADVVIDHVSVFGRLGVGGGLTGFSTAGLFLEATGTGFVLVVRIQNSYFQANAGDGIRASGNVNQVSIHQCRIQGNQAWGINVVAAEPRGWSITNSDIEGNTSGSIKSTGPLGLNITGNYFEGLASTDLIQLEGNATTPASGISIQGNIIQVGANGVGVRLGTATAIEGAVIEGNTFTGVASAIGVSFSAVSPTNSVLGPNRFLSGITANNSYSGRPGAGTMIRRDGDSQVLVTDSSVTSVTVSNTTVETNILAPALPAYTIDGPSGIRITAYGSYTNNSGAGANFTIRFRYQGTLILTMATLGVGASASPRAVLVECILQGNPSVTTSGVSSGWFDLGQAVTLGSGSSPTRTVAVNSLTIPDSSSPGGSVAISVQHSVADPNISFVMYGYAMETLPQ